MMSLLHGALHDVNRLMQALLILILLRMVYEVTLNRHRVPNAPSTRASQKALARRLQAFAAERASSGQPLRIVDLGSGNGALACHIARTLPDARVTGIEISPFGCFVSNLRKRLRRLHNLEFRKEDIFALDVSQFDAVVMFLSYGMMSRLRDKLRRELAPGKLVISNTFPVGGDWVPVETIELKGISALAFFTASQPRIYIYRQDEAARAPAPDKAD